MKTSVFSQAVLLLLAGAAVLLIGGLVKFDPEGAAPKTVSLPPALAPETADDSIDKTEVAPMPPNFSPSLAQVVKLTRAGVGNDVILAYVQDSERGYHPTADDLIYLHEAGVSDPVMAAIVKQKPRRPTPAPAPSLPETSSVETAQAPSAASGPETPEVAVETPGSVPENIVTPSRPAPTGQMASEKAAANFMNDLGPFGHWLQAGDYGLVWQPTVEQATPDWRPYVNDGRWESTDAGWYWQSTYSWGWAPFHYGRWVNYQPAGWVWQPGNQWAPAWVTFRQTSTHFGWAPLPPGVSLSVEFALLQDRHQSPAQADYGLTPSSYTFVPSSAFLRRDLASASVSSQFLADLVAGSVSADHFSTANARVRNFGIKPEDVAAAVHAPVRQYVLRDASSPVTPALGRGSRASGGTRSSRGDSMELAVYRPNFEAGEVAKLNK